VVRIEAKNRKGVQLLQEVLEGDAFILPFLKGVPEGGGIYLEIL